MYKAIIRGKDGETLYEVLYLREDVRRVKTYVALAKQLAHVYVPSGECRVQFIDGPSEFVFKMIDGRCVGIERDGKTKHEGTS
ncbi:MAG: hypothetical protein KatS3mg038_1015 [Candidatus Kapaibacterium sp.]|nr:MAG: hypothetical protein KatS3mg038_1015 [Candidatus Kapabacteria bacterium]